MHMSLERTLSTVTATSGHTSVGLVCEWFSVCGLPALCDVICILHTLNRRLLYTLAKSFVHPGIKISHIYKKMILNGKWRGMWCK